MNLTDKQMQALEHGEAVPIMIGGNRCVVVLEDVYNRERDDSPWTEEEMNLLADEADAIISRSETDEGQTR